MCVSITGQTLALKHRIHLVQITLHSCQENPHTLCIVCVCTSILCVFASVCMRSLSEAANVKG